MKSRHKSTKHYREPWGLQPPGTTQNKYLLLDTSLDQSTSLIAAVNLSNRGTKKKQRLLIAYQTVMILS